MPKKDYTAPFRGMLIIGSFYIFMVLLTSYVIEIVEKQDFVNTSFVITSILWVTLYFGEAIIYWRLRKKNFYRRDSRIHVWVIAIAVVLPLLKGIFIAAFDRTIGVSVESAMNIDYVQLGAFWVLQVVGHIFFVRVVVKCFRKGGEVMEGAPETGNMLDDFGID